MSRVQLRAKELLGQAFELSAEVIPDDASLESFEPWDSLGHVKVIMTVEEAIGRSLEIEEALQVASVDDLDRLLASLN